MDRRVGIYSLTGSVALSTANAVDIPADLTLNLSGNVYDVIPNTGALVIAGNEVVCHNAYHPTGSAGLDPIEYHVFSISNDLTASLSLSSDWVLISDVNGTSSYRGPTAWNNIYLSKQERLAYSMFKKVPTTLDLYNNIPQTAPSSSYVVASGLSVAGYKAAIGTVDLMPSGTGAFTGTIDLGSPNAPLANAVRDALVGNIIYVGELTASTYLADNVDNQYVTFWVRDGQSTSRSLDVVNQNVSILSMVPLSSSVSGVYLNRTYYEPSSIPINVSGSAGAIRDIKVWIEFIHDVRNQTNLARASGGLQAVQIALRSPNTNFYTAHPHWNSPAAQNLPLRLSGGIQDKYLQVPALLRNSYLLWAGHWVDAGLSETLNDATRVSGYHEFDRDIDMRTIFWDGSAVRNPRDMTVLFPSASALSPGPVSGTWSDLASVLLSGAYYPSPSRGALLAGVTGASGPPTPECSGAPWMLDSQGGTIPMGIYNGNQTLTGSSYVPTGWQYTGDRNEFRTSGTTLGPLDIRPMYPLLDDIAVFKATDHDVADLKSGVWSAMSKMAGHGPIQGSRPGLRGTRASGTWNVLVGSIAGDYTNNEYVAHVSGGVWFRQARLELVTDTNYGLTEFNPSRDRKWQKSSLVPAADGYHNLSVVSGAAAWDVGVNLVQRFQGPDYGRTVGITADQASTTYAVLSFITGALSSSDNSWFLTGNGFGTPYIPDSSMSLGNVAPEQIDAAASQEMYNSTIGQTTQVPNANTLSDYLNRTDFSNTTLQNWEKTLTALTGSGSGSNP